MARLTSRRAILGGGTALIAAALTVGCDALSTEPTGRREEKRPKGAEAPMLADRVEKGDLPPVEERLPADPMVVEPNEETGTYGGELRVILHESIPLGQQRIYFFAGYDNLVRWDVDFDGIVPNIAHDWEISDDATEYVFHLREGIKWSDGEPFTAEDVVFAVNDVLMNKELNPVTPSWLGEVTAEAIDDVTVKLTFTEPNGLLIQQMATERGSALTIHPAHYMKQFHRDHNPDVDTLVKEAQLDNWVDLYGQKADKFGTNTEKPALTAWLLTVPADQNQVIVERNPYYWKVDPDGSQLPYADRVVFDRVDPEAAVLRIANGDADFSLVDQALRDKPVLAESRERGGYRFLEEKTESMNEMSIHLNLTHKDPVLKEIFNTKDFRIALSHAINREDIISAVFQKQGEPWQIAPRRDTSYFDEEMAKQYTEYDPERANEILDKLFPDKNAQGMRLGPNGNTIHFAVTVTTGELAPWVDALEIVVANWREVGIDAELKHVSRELLTSTAEANLHDAIVWTGEGGIDSYVLLSPHNYMPVLVPWSFYAVGWGQWYFSGGTEGEEPPEPVKEQYRRWEEARATADPEEQKRLMREVLAIAKKEFQVMGISAPPQSYRTVSNRVKNWPKFTSGGDWTISSPGPTNPWQYFIP